MYNLRYHLASLMAVFLALAVGLVLGTVVVERGALDKQRTTLVDSLKTEFGTLRDNNQRLESELQHTNAFANAAVPVLVSDELAGRNVLVLINEGRSDGLTAVEKVLSQAGANVVTGRLVAKGLGLDDKKVVTPLGPLTTGAAGSPQLKAEVIAALASEWSSTSSVRPITKALVEGGELRLESDLPAGRIDAIVVMAVWNEAHDPVLMELGKTFTSKGAYVAAAQSSSRKTDLVVEAVNAGLSGVENVDRPEGAFSLVWLLTGRARGRFGGGPGSEGVFPALTTGTVSP